MLLRTCVLLFIIHFKIWPKKSGELLLKDLSDIAHVKESIVPTIILISLFNLILKYC